MNANSYANAIRNAKTFFDKSTSALEEADSGFTPKPGMYSAAQQVAHSAHTVDWFVTGAFGGGFDMDFAGHDAMVRKVTSLKEARAWMDRSVEKAVREFGSRSQEDLAKPLPQDGIMGGMPIGSCAFGIAEHTAHHRGSLATYTRLLGKTPPMPYM